MPGLLLPHGAGWLRLSASARNAAAPATSTCAPAATNSGSWKYALPCDGDGDTAAAAAGVRGWLVRCGRQPQQLLQQCVHAPTSAPGRACNRALRLASPG